jgi:competence protein ComEC
MQKKRYPDKVLRNRYVIAACAVLFAAVMAVSVFFGVRDDNTQKLKDSIKGLFCAHFIDVGQGNACLLSSPDGKFMLVDTGNTQNAGYLVKYLRDFGVEKIEYLVITHPHEDHYGGARDVIRNFEVEKLLICKEFKDTYPFDVLSYLLEDRNEKSETVLAGINDVYTFGDAEFAVISPEKVDFYNYNNSSLAIKILYKDTSFLFTGDAEKSAEYKMIKNGYNLESDVFCAAHHGSSSSNSIGFLECVNPKFIVISCAENNDYGHPHKESMKNFEKTGAKILLTYESGDIILASDGKEVKLLNEKNKRQA